MTLTRRPALIGVALPAATVLALGVSLSGFAQDPRTEPAGRDALPAGYTLQFENDSVRVVRVHYDAGARLGEHPHPGGLTAFVYLNDAGPVTFAHSNDGTRFTAVREAVAAGSFSVVSSSEERHTVRNDSQTPTDFLRIQIKAGTSTVARKRFDRRPYADVQTVVDEQFSNSDLTIARLHIPPGGTVDIKRTEPSLLVAIPSGETRWLDAGDVERLANQGTYAVEYLRLSVKNPKAPL